MTRKFLAFYKKNQFDFSNNAKWSKIGRTSLKLNSFDLDHDLCITSAQIKVLNNEQEPDKLWIEGIANANIVDRMQERLDPIGLDVANYLKNRQLLAHHSYYHPIGQVEDIKVTEEGVLFRAWVGNPRAAKLTEMQEEIISLIKQGILRTVSVGFIPKQIKPAEFDEQGNLTSPTVIEKWELLELSVVAIPANQGSIFEIKKSINEVDMERKKEIEEPKPEDNNEENMLSEILNLLRNVDSGVKQNSEMLKTIIEKIMAESKPETEETEETEEEETSKEDKIKSMEATLEKVIASISLIVKRLDELNT